MRELFNLLEDKEKKTLRVLIVFLAVAMLFLLLVSLPMKRNYSRSLSLQETKQSEYQHFSEITQQKENEWRQWQVAFSDIDDLKKSHFYSGKDAIKQMRIDIQRILNRARIPASQKKYSYTEFKKEKIKKMSVSFNVRGNYQSLKRFIQSVEEFPKFLIVEKVDFLDIDDAGSVLELKIILAGYYES
jgi:virulence-associated protein VapD